MVDKYIDAHAATHTIWELEGSAGERVRLGVWRLCGGRFTAEAEQCTSAAEDGHLLKRGRRAARPCILARVFGSQRSTEHTHMVKWPRLAA